MLTANIVRDGEDITGQYFAGGRYYRAISCKRGKSPGNILQNGDITGQHLARGR
jgi:hypothetical protein